VPFVSPVTTNRVPSGDHAIEPISVERELDPLLDSAGDDPHGSGLAVGEHQPAVSRPRRVEQRRVARRLGDLLPVAAVGQCRP
jgi:hypothetical protein